MRNETTPETKVCIVCGETYSRRANENRFRFSRRKACGNYCGDVLRGMSNRKEQMPPDFVVILPPNADWPTGMHFENDPTVADDYGRPPLRPVTQTECGGSAASSCCER